MDWSLYDIGPRHERNHGWWNGVLKLHLVATEFFIFNKEVFQGKFHYCTMSVSGKTVAPISKVKNKKGNICQ